MNMSKCKHSPNCRNMFWNDFSKNRSVCFCERASRISAQMSPAVASYAAESPGNHWEKSHVRRFCWRWKIGNHQFDYPSWKKTYSKVVEIYYTLSRWEPWQTKLFLWVWDQPGLSSTKSSVVFGSVDSPQMTLMTLKLFLLWILDPLNFFRSFCWASNFHPIQDQLAVVEKIILFT